MQHLASIVVPAHNEEGTIQATLRHVLADAEPGEFEVVVVCNGCTDSTAEQARRFDGVDVIELEEASKLAALREADRFTRTFPRIYLDADTLLTTDAARAMARSLLEGDALVAGVRADYDTSGAGFAARLYTGFWQELPVFSSGIIGAGVYAMSELGRARFDRWPEVLGDDQFVYRLFSPEERVTVTEHRSIVAAPPDLRTIFRSGVRVRLGNQELSEGRDHAPLEPPSAGLGTALRRSVGHPRGLAGALVFLVVNLGIRVRARVAPGSGDWKRASGDA